MLNTLEEAFASAKLRILDRDTFVRAVLSGRRRNMQVDFERIDLRLVEIKGTLNWQVSKMAFDAMKVLLLFYIKNTS